MTTLNNIHDIFAIIVNVLRLYFCNTGIYFLNRFVLLSALAIQA